MLISNVRTTDDPPPHPPAELQDLHGGQAIFKCVEIYNKFEFWSTNINEQSQFIGSQINSMEIGTNKCATLQKQLLKCRIFSETHCSYLTARISIALIV